MSTSMHGSRVVRQMPRISGSKLGEYLGAAAPRRERILRDQKYPSGFIIARYRDANHAIQAALVTGGDIPERLRAKAQMLAGRPAITKYQADSNLCSAQALQRFASLYPTLPLQRATAALTGMRSFPLPIEGVEISVAPTVLLTRQPAQIGALLLVFRKALALDPRSGEAIAEVMRRALIRAHLGDVAREMCIVVDVFSHGVFVPPARAQRLSGEIESACREIFVRWPVLAA